MEGTIAFAVAVILGAFITAEILPRVPFFTHTLANIRWPRFIMCTILTGISIDLSDVALLEAMSLQNDNLVIPVYMWMLLRLGNVNGN